MQPNTRAEFRTCVRKNEKTGRLVRAHNPSRIRDARPRLQPYTLSRENQPSCVEIIFVHFSELLIQRRPIVTKKLDDFERPTGDSIITMTKKALLRIWPMHSTIQNTSYLISSTTSHRKTDVPLQLPHRTNPFPTQPLSGQSLAQMARLHKHNLSARAQEGTKFE